MLNMITVSKVSLKSVSLSLFVPQLTSVIVEYCNSNYKTEAAQEEHWSCKRRE